MVERKVHSLDRRLSVSVPDMLKVETLTEEETTYSSTQVLSSCSPKSFSRSAVSLKSRNASVRSAGEDWPWAPRQAMRTEVTVTHPDAQGAGSPASEAKRKSSDDLFELLQGGRLSAALSDEGAEVGAWAVPGSACFSLIGWVIKGWRRGALFKEWMGNKNKHKPYVRYKLLETNSDILFVSLELEFNPTPFFLFWWGYNTPDFSDLLELLA